MRHNLRRGIHRGESSPRPAGWGTQPLRIQLRLLTFQFSCLPVHLSPLWGFSIWCIACAINMSPPLGLNAWHNLRRGIHRGESSPRPAGWGTQPLRIQLRVLTFQFSCLPVHLSPLWGFRYLVYRVCYKHVAPLGLNASQFAARYPSWGEFSSPSGLGNPTPTDPTSRAHVPIFVPPCSPVAPLGL